MMSDSTSTYGPWPNDLQYPHIDVLPLSQRNAQHTAYRGHESYSTFDADCMNENFGHCSNIGTIVMDAMLNELPDACDGMIMDTVPNVEVSEQQQDNFRSVQLEHQASNEPPQLERMEVHPGYFESSSQFHLAPGSPPNMNCTSPKAHVFMNNGPGNYNVGVPYESTNHYASNVSPMPTTTVSSSLHGTYARETLDMESPQLQPRSTSTVAMPPLPSQRATGMLFSNVSPQTHPHLFTTPASNAHLDDAGDILNTGSKYLNLMSTSTAAMEPEPLQKETQCSKNLPSQPHVPRPAYDPEKSKHIAAHLILLLHARKCKENVQCEISGCQKAKEVWRHMSDCTTGKQCKFRSCSASRDIFYSHYTNCKRKTTCPVCSKVPTRR